MIQNEQFFCAQHKLYAKNMIHTTTGDLGQTYDSYNTLEHYKQSDGMTVLYVGDLSYADNYPLDDGMRWDTWGRFVEPNAAYQPWIWTAGNHEIEFRPQIVSLSLSLSTWHPFILIFVQAISSSLSAF
jgi:hypothetical protein